MIWGMHDEFRAEHKVPTYPSVHQDTALTTMRKTGGRELEMDEVAAILWGNPEASVRGRPAALVHVAGTLKKTPISSRAAGDIAARRELAEPAAAGDTSWDLGDFVDQDEEE